MGRIQQFYDFAHRPELLLDEDHLETLWCHKRRWARDEYFFLASIGPFLPPRHLARHNSVHPHLFHNGEYTSDRNNIWKFPVRDNWIKHAINFGNLILSHFAAKTSLGAHQVIFFLSWTISRLLSFNPYMHLPFSVEFVKFFDILLTLNTRFLIFVGFLRAK